VANRLVDLEMVPYFKEQKYYEGLDAAATLSSTDKRRIYG